jgi:glycyl-tRNA synthetase beta chain
MEAGDYQEALGILAQLRGPIDTFFDEVLVMAEDAALRANRLALVRRVAALFGDLADFRKIQVEAPPRARGEGGGRA